MSFFRRLGFRPRIVGSFDEFALLECGSGPDEGNEVGCVDGAGMPPIDRFELAGGIDSEIARIVEQAQVQGLRLRP